MFERFTERARQVVVIAQDIARQHRHPAIGADHLLMACFAEEEGVASRVLTELGFDLASAGKWLIDRHADEALESASSGQTPFTPRAKKALEMSLREALAIGHNYIGTEHVLLGLVREAVDAAGDDRVPASPAGVLLEVQGITGEQIKTAVIQMLSNIEQGHRDRPKPVYDMEDPDVLQSATREHDRLRGEANLLGQVVGQLAASVASGNTKVRVDDATKLSRINTRRAPFLRPNPTFTVQDLQDIGDVALSSIDIVGLTDEYRDGYRQLANSISNLLNLVARDTRTA